MDKEKLLNELILKTGLDILGDSFSPSYYKITENTQYITISCTEDEFRCVYLEEYYFEKLEDAQDCAKTGFAFYEEKYVYIYVKEKFGTDNVMVQRIERPEYPF